MKKILILVTLMALLLTGCGSSKYDSFMEQGTTAVTEAKYEEALDFFAQALEEKSDDPEAKALETQTDYLVSAIKLEGEEKYEEAIALLEKIQAVESESDVVKTAAEPILADCQVKYEESQKLINKINKAVDKIKNSDEVKQTIDKSKEVLDKSKDALNDAKDKATNALNDAKTKAEEAINQN